MFPTSELFFNFFMWSKVQRLKLPVEETKMSISDMTPAHLKARLQGAERVTFGNKHTLAWKARATKGRRLESGSTKARAMESPRSRSSRSSRCQWA